jgi:hypothetical protein
MPPEYHAKSDGGGVRAVLESRIREFPPRAANNSVKSEARTLNRRSRRPRRERRRGTDRQRPALIVAASIQRCLSCAFSRRGV